MKRLLEFLINSKSTGIIKQTAGCIDLGLKSGTLWYNRNLGANSPEEQGLYYAWGETKGYDLNDKHDFSEKNYNDDLCTIKELDKDNDAATVALGNGYHMPTLEQCMELQESTTKIYDTGIGLTLISRFNDNKIFFPETLALAETHVVPSIGMSFWTNTTKNCYYEKSAKIMRFDKVNKYIKEDGWDRYYGLPIRPVKE